MGPAERRSRFPARPSRGCVPTVRSKVDAVAALSQTACRDRLSRRGSMDQSSVIEDIPSSTTQRKLIMNDVKQVACNCAKCSGANCTCGCQKAPQRAVCPCGTQCKCQPACACAQA